MPLTPAEQIRMFPNYRGTRQLMTELEALRYAQTGQADYTTDRHLTELANRGLWALRQTGEKMIDQYVAHGGFTVDRWATFTSYLTAKGATRLAYLAAKPPTAQPRPQRPAQASSPRQ